MSTWQWYQTLSPQDQSRVREVLLHEARGEGVQGMAAAGQTLFNRVQGRPDLSLDWHTSPDRFENFQFGGRAYTPEQQAQALAAVRRGAPEIGMATHYYNPDKANPYWASQMQDKVTLGNHVFGNLGSGGGDMYLAGLKANQPVGPMWGGGESVHAKNVMPSTDPRELQAVQAAMGLLSPVQAPIQELPAVQSAIPEMPAAGDHQAYHAATSAPLMEPMRMSAPQVPSASTGLLGAAAPSQGASAMPALASGNGGLLSNTPFDFFSAIRKGFGQLL